MILLMTSQLFIAEVILFSVLGATYLWFPEFTSEIWGFIAGFSIGWPTAWVFQELKKGGKNRPRTFLKTALILALPLFSCSQETLESKLSTESIKVKEKTQKAAAVQGIEGTWTIDLETNTHPFAHLADSVINVKQIPNDQLLLNGTDTLCLISSNEYYSCGLFNTLASGIMKGSKLQHTQLYPDPVTQMSYLITVNYTR